MPKLGPLPTYARQAHPVAESAATLERPAVRTAVRETPTVVEAPTAASAGRLRIALIRAGWSLNGNYYPAEVLKRDGAAAWPAGTQCFIDHATDAEDDDRPSGSIKNLAAVTLGDATWNDATASLEAEVRLFAPWREAITDMAEHIGMSIRAWVYGENGEAEGRKGFLITAIPEGRSVDFVTVPAAGGAILSVLESVQHRQTVEARNVGAWIESRLHLNLTQIGDDLYGDGRLTRDERITLSSAIGDGLQAWTARVEADAPQLFTRDLWAYPEPAADEAEEARRASEQSAEDTRAALGTAVVDAHGGEDIWTWIRDFDPERSLVWFHVSSNDAQNLYQQGYELGSDGVASLTGERVEVTARTVYSPVGGDSPDDGDTAEESAGAESYSTSDVTDGAPPTAPNPPTEQEPGMSGTETGTPPVQAGTATVVDTPPANTTTEATGSAAVNEAVLRAMEALTTQVTALTARADRADQENQRLRNQQTARESINAALAADTVPADLRAQIAPRVTAAVMANVPVGESGAVDTAALATAIQAAITAESTYAAQLLERAGIGRVQGLGETVQPQSADDFQKEMAETFEVLGLSPKAAEIAAKGRG